MLSRFEGGDGGFRMNRGRQADGYQIDVVAGDDFPEILAHESGNPMIPGELFRLFRIQIRERPHLATVLKGLEGLDVDFGDGAGADDRYSYHIPFLLVCDGSI